MNQLSSPPAVILDLGFAGYGAVRSLAKFNVPIIGFINTQRYFPEYATSLVWKKIKYSEEEELLEKLKEIGHAYDRPTLYLTTDLYVIFFKNHMDELAPLFRMNFPDPDTVDMMMNKEDFYDFAIQHNIKVPKTLNMKQWSDYEAVASEFEFPLVLKPSYRKKAWNQAGLPKAFFLYNQQELSDAFEKSAPIDNNLLVQEYIPGEDWDIYHCLAYFDENSECLGAFMGKKLRQWPVDTGTSTATVPYDDDALKEESIRIFQLANYRGFGSVEFKRHTENGGFYVIEPTVGRLDQNEYVCTLNGLNMPMIGHQDLQQLAPINFEQTERPAVYIEELTELASAFTHIKRGNISIGEWWKSLSGLKKGFRYLNPKDLRVFLGLFVKILTVLKKKIFR
ncbi:MAG: hypothetical protein AAF587_01420 [Bacteroidota bacterium]